MTFGWPAALAQTLPHVRFGKDRGLFKDERIEVEAVSIKGSVAIIQQIISANLARKNSAALYQAFQSAFFSRTT